MIGQTILAMLNAATAAHVLHLKTRSYAAHVALGEFYAGIEGIADRLAEVYQGLHGLIPWKATTFSLTDDAEGLIARLESDLRACRAELAESELQNIADEALALCASTTYKLKFLK